MQSLCLLVYVGDRSLGTRVSSTTGSGSLVLGSPLSSLEHNLFLAISPSAQKISSGGCCSSALPVGEFEQRSVNEQLEGRGQMSQPVENFTRTLLLI